ncbi:hypothetical protein [Dyella sp.]|jgi:hypothetical protein|uniref:hypothetical protein n=1 Tax=Dyella sp. TaxID=1869338 RepID=UPI002D76E63F|nr:hypothetical protein [Dyella sp.]HET6432193.1 hypothetical protein [Dyella sp.]
MSLVVLQVPFERRVDGSWVVNVRHGEDRHFRTRVAGLAFAVEEARRLSRRDVPAIVSVEGADGHWRVFDTGMKHFAV